MLLGIYLYFHFLGIYRDFKIILSNFRHFLVFFYKAFFLAKFFQNWLQITWEAKNSHKLSMGGYLQFFFTDFYFFYFSPFYEGSKFNFHDFSAMAKNREN